MISTTKKDITWNYLGNILNLGMSVFILPVVLKLLSAQELGLWYVFGSVAALVQLMDFGFSPSIMRNISYAWSGATELMTEGVSEVSGEGCPNYALVASLVGASRKIYLYISLAAGAVLLSLGSIYIESLLPPNSGRMMLAWIIYSVAGFVNLFYGYWSPMLRGIGKIKESNQAMVIARAVYIMIAVIGLWIGGGLVWLSICYLISGLLLNFLSKAYFCRAFGTDRTELYVNKSVQTGIILRTIWPNAKKQGIVTIGAWLVTRANTLICSSLLGLEITSQYGLSLQLFSMVGGISTLLFGSYSPELASLKVGRQRQRFIQIFSRAISIQWIVALVGILSVIYGVPPILESIGSNSRLLPSSTLLVLGAVLFLEWNHSTFATLITLSNKVPFVKASIYSGIAIVALSLATTKMTQLGILGLILSQGFVQLAYNNWYWPKIVLNENNISTKSIIHSSSTEMFTFVKSKFSRS